MSASEIVATVKLACPVTAQMAYDILTSCAEGGSVYWLSCNSLTRDEESNVIAIKGPVDAEDHHNPGTPYPKGKKSWPTITLKTVARGIERIVTGQLVASLNASIVNDVCAYLRDPETANWDAETADCILQAGMFGTIVYG